MKTGVEKTEKKKKERNEKPKTRSVFVLICNTSRYLDFNGRKQFSNEIIHRKTLKTHPGSIGTLEMHH
jgi:hypothetical protein